MNAEWITRNEKPKRFFSPSNEDQVFKWRDDNNAHHDLIVPRGQISEFPAYQADFLIKHLADIVMNERGKSSPLDREKILEEINI